MKTLLLKSGFASDEELVEKIQAGETALFEVLIRRYNPLLYKIARSYGFDHHDAEDLMQESHFAAYLNVNTFRKEASYKTWLTRIHLNRCYHKRHSPQLKHEEANEELLAGHDSPMQARIDNRETENKVLNRELARVLEESLQQLPQPYRTVFVLREMEGFNVAETAELLGLTAVNVKVRLNRAKTMLQKQLEKTYSIVDLYEFHFMYCDKIVRNVFERIAAIEGC
ncbi:MAG TPA: sigma-70 family RNA polymerase sigma factor [Flavisolibacter sp.]|nr:sigma-70 family RNA polymerase sigma factor [Flavisolibacter sp.]